MTAKSDLEIALAFSESATEGEWQVGCSDDGWWDAGPANMHQQQDAEFVGHCIDFIRRHGQKLLTEINDAELLRTEVERLKIVCEMSFDRVAAETHRAEKAECQLANLRAELEAAPTAEAIGRGAYIILADFSENAGAFIADRLLTPVRAKGQRVRLVVEAK